MCVSSWGTDNASPADQVERTVPPFGTNYMGIIIQQERETSKEKKQGVLEGGK